MFGAKWRVCLSSKKGKRSVQYNHFFGWERCFWDQDSLWEETLIWLDSNKCQLTFLLHLKSNFHFVKHSLNNSTLTTTRTVNNILFFIFSMNSLFKKKKKRFVIFFFTILQPFCNRRLKKRKRTKRGKDYREKFGVDRDSNWIHKGVLVAKIEGFFQSNICSSEFSHSTKTVLERLAIQSINLFRFVKERSKNL